MTKKSWIFPEVGRGPLFLLRINIKEIDMSDPSIIKRISFVKYLYNFGVEQSYKPEPMSAASILIFHDAIELFNQIALEYKGDDVEIKEKLKEIGKKEDRLDFMDYWKILELTQKESIRRFNKARVGLKHHGNLPSRIDVESFRSAITNYFEENTIHLFGIEFSQISLINIVDCDETKNYLSEANDLLEEGQVEDALDKIGFAYTSLIDYFFKKKGSKLVGSPFFPKKTMSFSRIRNEIEKLKVPNMGNFLKEIEKLVVELQDAVKITTLGIDYQRFVKFRSLMPDIQRSLNGTNFHYRSRWWGDEKPSAQEVMFCINFVIEVAISLQNKA